MIQIEKFIMNQMNNYQVIYMNDDYN